MSAIWFHDEGQREIINAAKQEVESRLEAKAMTPVLPLAGFHDAEDYHQKYCLQGSRLMDRFKAVYRSFADFNNSTAAARLNGFVAGRGSRELFDEEYESYGFSLDELKRSIRI